MFKPETIFTMVQTLSIASLRLPCKQGLILMMKQSQIASKQSYVPLQIKSDQRCLDIGLLNFSASKKICKCMNTQPYQIRFLLLLLVGVFRRDSVVDGETIRKKAMLIGHFVANQMSGLDASEVCSNHTLDLHINEIKVRFTQVMKVSLQPLIFTMSTILCTQ